jgi:hypothetical protein
MAAVADRRFDDAIALIETGRNARANGAAYLAGFVIEILLKARLVTRFPTIAAMPPHHAMSARERSIWRLIWREHDLEKMLESMPELEASLRKRGERDGRDYLVTLRGICATWSVFARYSSHTITVAEAKGLLDRVRAVKELLK